MSQTKAQLVNPLGEFTLTSQLVGVGATFSGDVSIGGTLTKQDVTNVDSVGLITARSGIKVTGGNVSVNNGTLGVGTDTPAGDLDVVDDNNSASIYIKSGNTQSSDIYFGRMNDNITAAIKNDHSDDSFRFYGYNNTERIRIDSTGRITAGKDSIGTSNDAAEWFKVQSNDTAANISIVGSNDTHSTLNLGDEDDFNIQKIKSNHVDNSLQLYTADTKRLHLDNQGRIGINTDTFSDAREALRVQSVESDNTFLTIKAPSTTGYSALFFGDDDFNEGRIQYMHSSNALQFYTDDTVRLTISNVGDLSSTGQGTFAGILTASSLNDSLGDVRSIPRNDKTANYVAVASDAGKNITCNISSGSVTINTGVFAEADAVTILNYGSTDLTVIEGSGFALTNCENGNTGNRTLASKGMCTIYFLSDTVGYITGAGLS